MREDHPRAFTGPQLRVLAERNGRPISLMFESCPLCGTKDARGRLEDHIEDHLRFLALKSLPAFEDERSESSDFQRGSVVSSRGRSKTTIEGDPERNILPTFEDLASGSTSHGCDLVTFDRQTPSREAEAVAVEQDQSEGLRHNIGHAPPDDLKTEGENQATWHQDPSSDFIDDTLFAEIAQKDRYHFEWGFLDEANDTKLARPEINAPNLRPSLCERLHKGFSQNTAQHSNTTDLTRSFHANRRPNVGIPSDSIFGWREVKQLDNAQRTRDGSHCKDDPWLDKYHTFADGFNRQEDFPNFSSRAPNQSPRHG